LTYLCTGNAQAGTTYQPTLKGFQFYAGISGGGKQLSGRRSDSIDEEDINNTPARLQTSLRNQRISEKNAVVSIMAGFWWKMPRVPLLIGPEIYLGRGNTLSSVKDTRSDPFVPGFFRTYSTDFQRKLFGGAVIRLGYQFCENYLAYLSFGADRSQFSLERAFRYNDDVPGTLIKKTKGLNGAVFGAGLEKSVDKFIVGIDCRVIQYRRYNSVDPLQVSPGNEPASINFSLKPTIINLSLRVAYRF
jgi:hypothetical protein